jgi:hypothetical protein
MVTNEQLAKLVEGLMMVARHVLGPAVDPLELNVEVSDGTENGGKPSELLAEANGADWQHLLEKGEGSPQPPGGDTHLVQILRVVAEAGSGLVGDHRGGVFAQHRVGEISDARGGCYFRAAEVRAARNGNASGEKTCLELGQGSGLEATVDPQALYQGCERLDPGWQYLDFDTLEPQPVPISANNDHGVIERNFANGGPVNGESERSPPSPHFEDLPESPCAGKRPDAAADRTLRVEVGDARRRERLGHF